MMISRLRSFLRAERGSTVIEFAVVSPMVIMFVIAAVQFGQALRVNAGLRELAGWAGRKAVISYQVLSNTPVGEAQLESLIEAEAGNPKYNIIASKLDPDADIETDTTLVTVKRVRIQITYPHEFDLPLLPKQTLNLKVDRTFFVPHTASI